MAIKISEIFGSLQGEGLHTGTPSVFVRTFGCNKRCEGFGLPRGVKNTELVSIDPAGYKDYHDLPLVKTGCDSYASSNPKFRDLSPSMEIPDIVDRIQSCLVGGRFSKDAHLVLTGGEPLLWQSQIPALLDEIRVRAMDLTDLTFETNGTVELSNDLFFALLDDVDHGLTITFSVSPKLPCSGETWESSILPGVVMGYADFPNSRTYLKFVVGDAQDFEDVQNAVKEYRAAGFQGSIYVMPIGGTTESYYLNNKKVCELAITHGYRYSPRLQVDLYGNAWSK